MYNKREKKRKTCVTYLVRHVYEGVLESVKFIQETSQLVSVIIQEPITSS